jgi:hypothetical protein
MSLKAFHILFISIACVLAFGFGAWCVKLQRTEGDGRFVALGGASFFLGATLLLYGAWFVRKLRRWEDDAARRKTSPMRGGGGDHRSAPPGSRLGL